MASTTAIIVAWAELTDRQASLASVPAPDLFPCPNPFHRDGDAIRCHGERRSDRLYAIDAPEIPGACRPGRQCTPGDPYASRDHLRALTAGKVVQCRQVDLDHYGRRVLQCFADGVDLSCAMVRDGYAVERYGRLAC
ncbi:thermonuclease family protein [Rhizorhabdus sp.]|uniref:thermonuclease family protein n=1 Tax=Rhizorhabdus sp. TaxID=1968843 RepID=UPI0019C667A8|nr:thermonuclease family protein [Rhizorhabdus sp.]MBD3761481.1 thermonuclease family protein [Rhizorhabdus sp.]